MKIKRKHSSIIEIIRTTTDAELLNYIGSKFPHLQSVIYKKIIGLNHIK